MNASAPLSWRTSEPDVLLFTGGYITVPMAFAVANIRTLLLCPRYETALKTLARFADRIALTAEESRRFLSLAPRPCRHHRLSHPTPTGQWDRAAARDTWVSTTPRLPVLLVSGGSQGARNINQALLPLLPHLLAQAQIIHLTGETTWPDVQAARDALSPQLSANYPPHPLPARDRRGPRPPRTWLSHAPEPLCSANSAFRLPAILSSYPYAWRYQHVNADYPCNRGAALLIEDSALATALIPAIENLLSRRTAPRDRRPMQILSRRLRPEIAALLLELAAVRPQKGFGVS